jgi:hypothetical protein
MYWAGTVIFITLVVGYMSAYSWLLYNQRRTQIRIKDLPAVTAHVIHAGQRGLLIYEPTAKKSDRASSELEHLLKELKELKELISSNDSVGRGRIRLVLWSVARQFCVIWQNMRCLILFHCVLQQHERKGVMT